VDAREALSRQHSAFSARNGLVLFQPGILPRQDTEKPLAKTLAEGY
jgi:hypothetical protein